MESKTYSVALNARTGKKTVGSLRVNHWSKEERLKRAFKLGLACWGLAVVSVFLPIAHFILVPLFFLSGPFVTLYIYRQENQIEGGDGMCPYCDKPLKIGGGPVKWPPVGLEELCTQCQNNCTIQV